MGTQAYAETRLMDILAGMRDAPVLVAGDIMLDQFIYGHVERISPESPVPVLSVDREDLMLGGAGNALANLAGLGAQGRILSIIGDDAAGQSVRDHVRKLGFDDAGLIADPQRPTIVKTRFLAGHQQLLRTDFEKKTALPDALAEKLLQQAAQQIKGAKALLISDYGKGLLRKDVLEKLIALAQKNGIPVMVDPKGSDFTRYKGASAITPNRKELAEATGGMATETDEDIIAAAKKLIDTCGINAVIATRSADGMSVIQKNKEPLHLRTADIEVFDVSGAGDTVIATIAAALAAGASLEEAAQLANIAGGIVVTKVGTAPIRAEEISDALQDDSASRKNQAGLSSTEQALETVKRWRARGLKIGFTNGCFDVLHRGHISYLGDARQKCDRLIVGLNRDTSVKILKGPERPVHDEESRAAVLGALGAVDMVVLFGALSQGDDNTATALIQTLQPDVYFKGGDYTAAQIPEAPAVQSYGGEIAIMPEYAGHSTTASVKKMKAV